MILNQILINSAKKYPNRPALTMKIGFRTATLTYAQTYEIAKKLAVFLEQQGIGKDDKVLICAPNSPYWICAFWATMLRGAIVVPLNIQSTKNIIDKIAAQTEAKILFKHLYFKHEMPEHLKQFNIEFINDLISDIDAKQFKQTEIDKKDLFQIMYTSGTTGDPKGVMLTHENVYSNIQSVSKIIVVNLEKDKLLSILPLSHIFEQTCGFLLPYSRGVHIVYTHSYAALRNLMRKHQITKLMSVPEFLQILMNRIEAEIEAKGYKNFFDKLSALSNKINNRAISRFLFKPILNSLGGKLDTIASGGAPLRIELEQKWESFGIEVLQGYGLTETSPIVSTNNFNEKKLGSVGKVIPGVTVKIADDHEILVKGPNVFVGYYKNEQKTKETFTNDGWFKTGDMGDFDEDKFLFIRGRKKYVIIGAGGQNVYPEDIEAELIKIDGVNDAAVIGIEKEHSVEIHAFLLIDQKKNVNAAQAIAQANEHLATYQQITAHTIWPDIDFPRTVTRKVKKEDLRKYLESKEKLNSSISEQKKSKLIQIISQITGIDAAEINESSKLVGDLNVDSLMRVELVSWIEEDMAIIIDETDITAKTTVGDLEQMIKAKKPSKQASLRMWTRSQILAPFKYLGQFLTFIAFKPFVNLKVQGLENLKDINEPVIFMPNHISFLDSLVLAKALPFRLRKKLAFAAARDVLYDHYKHIATLIEIVFNSFPIQRGENENIKLGLEFIGQMLDNGYCLAIFPEGRMSKDGQLLPLKKGTGLIATEMQVPIVPVKIIGSSTVIPYEKSLPQRRGKVTVIFGKPMKFKRSDSHSEVTEKIEQAMKNL